MAVMINNICCGFSCYRPGSLPIFFEVDSGLVVMMLSSLPGTRTTLLLRIPNIQHLHTQATWFSNISVTGRLRAHTSPGYLGNSQPEPWEERKHGRRAAQVRPCSRRNVNPSFTLPANHWTAVYIFDPHSLPATTASPDTDPNTKGQWPSGKGRRS
jgi:hypothetical protein